MLTTLVEVPLVVLLTRDVGEPIGRRVLVATLAQLVTHPLVWFVFPFLPGLTGWTSLLASELWAFAAEAILYVVAFRRVSALGAIGCAGLANGASFAAGLLLHGR